MFVRNPKFLMIDKYFNRGKFLFLKIEFSNLAEKICPIFKLKYSKFEQDPLNMKDFIT